MFQDFVDDMLQKEIDEKRELTKRKIDNLRSLFAEKRVDLTTSWKELGEMFKHDQLFNSADPLEQITAFEDYIKTLERQDY